MYIVHVHFLGLKEANDVTMDFNLKCFKLCKMRELEKNYFNPAIQVNNHKLGKISATHYSICPCFDAESLKAIL